LTSSDHDIYSSWDGLAPLHAGRPTLLLANCESPLPAASNIVP
jgi:hypothetical protein